MEMVPWAELPAYVRVGFVAMFCLVSTIGCGLAGMLAYDYDYFNDSPLSLDLYRWLTYIGGLVAVMGLILLGVSVAMRLSM